MSSHRWLSPEERQKIGIGDGFIRVSVGIEAIEDITADFSHALDVKVRFPLPMRGASEEKHRISCVNLYGRDAFECSLDR